MDELLKKYVYELDELTDDTRKQMDFFSLALYLQELNKMEELCEYELGDDDNE